MTLVRMNAFSPAQWKALMESLKPQNAGYWDIDWSDDKSDCES